MSATVKQADGTEMTQPVRLLTVAPPAVSAARASLLLRGFFDYPTKAAYRASGFVTPWRTRPPGGALLITGWGVGSIVGALAVSFCPSPLVPRAVRAVARRWPTSPAGTGAPQDCPPALFTTTRWEGLKVSGKGVPMRKRPRRQGAAGPEATSCPCADSEHRVELSVGREHGIPMSVSADIGLDPGTRQPRPMSLVLHTPTLRVKRHYVSSQEWLVHLVESLVLPGLSPQEAQASTVCLDKEISALWSRPIFGDFPLDDGATKAGPEVTRKHPSVPSGLPCPPWLAKTTWHALVRRDERSCLACYIFLTNEMGPTAHHLLPRDRGGNNDLENLVLLCQPCHDRLEADAESKLFATNQPPRREQIEGIYEADGYILPTTIRVISAEVKTRHANRLIATKPAERLRTLYRMAIREDRWPHVDWRHVRPHQEATA